MSATIEAYDNPVKDERVFVLRLPRKYLVATKNPYFLVWWWLTKLVWKAWREHRERVRAAKPLLRWLLK